MNTEITKKYVNRGSSVEREFDCGHKLRLPYGSKGDFESTCKVLSTYRCYPCKKKSIFYRIKSFFSNLLWPQK